MNIVLHWPQITWLTYVTLLLVARSVNSAIKKDLTGFFTSAGEIFVCLWVLYEGGFFMGVTP